MKPTYRQWLQAKADAGDDAAAYALKYQGDDGGINGNWVVLENNARANPDQEYSGFLLNRGSQMRGLHSQYQAAFPAQSGGGTGGGTGGSAAPADPDEPIRQALRAEITNRGGEVDAVYGSLFGDIDNLIKARDAELTTQYGQQRGSASSQYAEVLPEIDMSYAALGSYDSTQRGDKRGKAKRGYEETLDTIAKNEGSDKAKLGQYGIEQKAKFNADKEAAKRNVARAGETTDVNALRGLRNELETNLSTAGVTRAGLTPEGEARKNLTALTSNNGRYEAAINALDSIFKSSMASDVKEAAVEAVSSSAGLSPEEKKKVQEQYGNVYAEQAAL